MFISLLAFQKCMSLGSLLRIEHLPKTTHRSMDLLTKCGTTPHLAGEQVAMRGKLARTLLPLLGKNPLLNSVLIHKNSSRLPPWEE